MKFNRHGAHLQGGIASAACSDNGRGFANISSETRSIGTVRARIGQTFDRLTVYGTGGAAFADIKTTVGVNCLVDGCGSSGGANTTAATFSNFKTGWVAGGGIEWMFSPNWIVRAEYLHIDLGKVSNTLNLGTDNCFGDACGGDLVARCSIRYGARRPQLPVWQPVGRSTISPTGPRKARPEGVIRRLG